MKTPNRCYDFPAEFGGEVMRGFVQGADRQQDQRCCRNASMIGSTRAILFGVVHVFVDALELRDLEFDGVSILQRPAGRLTILRRCLPYIYGYLNRVQSSRRLEREAGRRG